MSGSAKRQERLRASSAGGKAGRAARADRPTSRAAGLKDSEHPYRVIIEAMNEGAVTVDASGRILYANQRFAEMVGLPPRRVKGSALSEFVAADHRTLLADILEDGAKTNTRGEVALVAAGDRRVDVRLSAAPLASRGTRAVCLLVSDVGKLKAVSEALRASEERFRTAVESTLDGFMICSAVRDRRGRIRDFVVEYVNEPGARMNRLPREQMIGARWLNLYPDARKWGLFEKYVAIVETGQPFVRDEMAYEAPAEKKFKGMFFDVRAAKLGDGFAAAWRDATERIRLELELVNASSRERRLIGQEIHDLLAQDLVGIAMLSKGLEHRLVEEGHPEGGRASEISQLAGHAARHARAIARGLSPVELRADGLMEALRELAAATASLHGISCRFRCQEPVLVHDDAAAMHLYRIAQEAVSNALRHGKARRVLISMESRDGWNVLRIKDDGKGLQAKPRKKRGMGLRLMAYRCRMIGGTVDVRNDSRGGVVVECSFRATAP